MTDSIHKLVIYGAGLAGQMTALALSKSLPSNYEISLINDTSIDNKYDVLYGNICSPISYDFHLALGISEPDLLFKSDSTFSYGSHYQNWGECQRDWVQCFHLPLPIQESVEFHQSLLCAGISNLEPYLVSAQAARHGVFAHPPQDSKIPLSRAEYGYHVSANSYLNAFSNALNSTTSQNFKRIETQSITVSVTDKGIESLQLSNGEKVDADWFIDCSGPKATVLSSLDTHFITKRKVNFSSNNISVPDVAENNKSARKVSALDFGWQSETSLQGKVIRLTLFSDEGESEIKQSGEPQGANGEVKLGHFDKAWKENCIAIGHAASVIEPLTPAPMMVLQRDIQRLLELIPTSLDDTVERKEFNRRFALDNEHANLFNDAFYQCDDLPNTTFWQQAKSVPMNEKLSIKLTQFESRAIISMFDLEPFNEQDWLILHFGMQRKPARYSRFAQRHSSKQLNNWFSSIESSINSIVKKMPPADRYLSKMLDYLRSQT